jgi:hypothetical protein
VTFNFFSCDDAMIQDWVYPTNAVGHENSRWTPIELMKEVKMNRRVTKELPKIASILEETLRQWYIENKPDGGGRSSDGRFRPWVLCVSGLALYANHSMAGRGVADAQGT